MPDSNSRDILVLAAHPDLARSQVTRALLAALPTSPAARRVELRDLYRLYPDYSIRIDAEQRALAAARLVVLLHPIHWYGMPALQKLWLDEVLRLGWAYGPGGTALRGKDCWLVTSTGGSAQAYDEAGYHRHAFDGFLLPLRCTAEVCSLRWLPPQVLHAAHRASDAEVQAHAELFLERLAHYPDWCPDWCEPPASSAGDEAALALDERPPLFSPLDGEAAE